jgi:hypothetical protein
MKPFFAMRRHRRYAIALIVIAGGTYGFASYSITKLNSDFRVLAADLAITTRNITVGSFSVSRPEQHSILFQYTRGDDSAVDALRRQDFSAKVRLIPDAGPVIEGSIPPVGRVSSEGKSLSVAILDFYGIKGVTYRCQLEIKNVPDDLASRKATLTVGVSHIEYGLWWGIETISLLVFILAVLIAVILGCKAWRASYSGS